jgi:trk system potassium uptake protein TrkA
MIGEFMVIGLGRFGKNLTLNLARQGQSVMAVDIAEEEVQRMAAEIDAVACADVTDEAALRELHPERMTCVVVAIGVEAVQASILATTLLRQIGVPRIIARAVDELHARVLRAVGAHEIVNPEAEIGASLARRLAQPNVFSQLALADDADLAEILVPAEFVDKTLVELDMRNRYGITVVAIRREGRVHAGLGPKERLQDKDILIIIGSTSAIRRLAGMA